MEDEFPKWLVQKIISSNRARFNQLSGAANVRKSISFTKCISYNLHKLRRDLYPKRIKDYFDVLWGWCIAEQIRKYRGRFDELSNWLSKEYKILDRMNAHNFKISPSSDILWDYVSVRKVEMVHRLYSRNWKKKVKNYWWQVTNDMYGKLKAVYENIPEKGDLWKLNITANMNKLNTIYKNYSWNSEILQNYKKCRTWYKGNNFG